jgi:hypothetical protein
VREALDQAAPDEADDQLRPYAPDSPEESAGLVAVAVDTALDQMAVRALADGDRETADWAMVRAERLRTGRAERQQRVTTLVSGGGCVAFACALGFAGPQAAVVGAVLALGGVLLLLQGSGVSDPVLVRLFETIGKFAGRRSHGT